MRERSCATPERPIINRFADSSHVLLPRYPPGPLSGASGRPARSMVEHQSISEGLLSLLREARDLEGVGPTRIGNRRSPTHPSSDRR